jgi:hypothetical protein
VKYRKKPVVIEATQWFKNGDHPLDYANEKVGLEKGEFLERLNATYTALNA